MDPHASYTITQFLDYFQIYQIEEAAWSALCDEFRDLPLVEPRKP